MKKPKIVVITVVVTVVVIFAVGGVRRKKGNVSKNAKLVHLEQVQYGELIEFVSAPGEIEPKKNVEISAKVSSRIVKLPYDEGDVVTSGDPNANPPQPASVLVRLDAKDLESQLRSAQAGRLAQAAQVEVEKAKIAGQKSSLTGFAASFKEATKDLERKKGLLGSQDISQSMFDQSQCRVDELNAQHEAAKYNLKSAELNLVVLNHNLEAADARISQAKEALSYTVISSPINGVVTRVNAEEGEIAMTGTMNNPGTVILEVADLSQMLVVAQVDEADIGELKVGQRAKVYVQAFSDIQFKGVVDTIALKHTMSRNATKYYRTEVLLDNDANTVRLYSGLTADVDIETKKHANVIKVPSQAVLARAVDSLPLDIRENSECLDKNKMHTTVVYLYVDGKAVVTPVKIGPSDLTHIIISSGINADDKVIIGPYKVLDGLKHDQLLKDERQEEAKKETSDQQTEVNEPANDKT